MPPSIDAAMELSYYVILLFFILEFVLKLYYSDDRAVFVRTPIHLFDLFIIIASLAATMVGFLPQAGVWPILLRLLRLPTALVLGGRTLSRGGLIRREVLPSHEPPPMTAWRLPLDHPRRGWVMFDFALDGHDGAWLRFANVSDEHVPALGKRYGLSGLILGRRIWEWAYPRAEDTGGQAAIFLQVPVEERSDVSPSVHLVRWVGVLLMDRENGMVSLSRGQVPMLDEVPEMAEREGLDMTTATAFYLIMSDSLGKAEDFIEIAEVELARMESIPIARRPRAFLTVIYGVKKEIDHTLSWLVHARKIFKSLLGRSVALNSWGASDDVRTKALLERCDFLLETAEDLAEGLADDIGFYLDTTSYQMNTVMKVIAVLTALAIVPTVVGGLLGMNLVGNPWDVSLAEMVTAVTAIMLFTAWIYYQMGWLKS